MWAIEQWLVSKRYLCKNTEQREKHFCLYEYRYVRVDPIFHAAYSEMLAGWAAMNRATALTLFLSGGGGRIGPP